MNPTCPICKSSDHIRFVFAGHHPALGEQSRTMKNLSVYSEIFMCDQLHIYDTRNRIIKNLRPGTHVRLRACEGEPEQDAIIESIDPMSETLVVRIDGIGRLSQEGDDGLREVTEDHLL